jgi:hypothetical protein
MDDPLVPEDEALLREKLTQKLSGLNVDPETGQIDMIELLDRLSQQSLVDLQLNLSGRLDRQEIEAEQIDQTINELAEQMSLFMTGSQRADGSTQPAADDEKAPYPSSVPIAAAALGDFELAEEQLLVAWNGDYLAVPIVEVVKRDLRLSGGRLVNYARTDCFFSVAHALGEGPEEWLPEEEARIALMNRLEQELGEQYQQLGAFSLEEAMRQYFSPDLVASFVTGKAPEELQRVREWVIYTRQTRGLKNPAGFLRSRLESDETPPDFEPTT